MEGGGQEHGVEEIEGFGSKRWICSSLFKVALFGIDTP